MKTRNNLKTATYIKQAKHLNPQIKYSICVEFRAENSKYVDKISKIVFSFSEFFAKIFFGHKFSFKVWKCETCAQINMAQAGKFPEFPQKHLHIQERKIKSKFHEKQEKVHVKFWNQTVSGVVEGYLKTFKPQDFAIRKNFIGVEFLIVFCLSNFVIIRAKKANILEKRPIGGTAMFSFSELFAKNIFW